MIAVLPVNTYIELLSLDQTSLIGGAAVIKPILRMRLVVSPRPNHLLRSVDFLQFQVVSLSVIAYLISKTI
jgi:hypothetical protein